MQTQHYIYLHGFASSPNSVKACYFKQKFAAENITLIMPDMNQNDFTNLTLTRQLNYVRNIINQLDGSITILGSSMGGLTALLLAEQIPHITQIMLLAPAFAMSEYWGSLITPEQMEYWRTSGQIAVPHYGYGGEIPLNYNFTQDLYAHKDRSFQRKLPVLICHGIHDKVVPIEFSREYRAQNEQAQLIELNDDHGLTNSMDMMWKEIRKFCVL